MTLTRFVAKASLLTLVLSLGACGGGTSTAGGADGGGGACAALVGSCNIPNDMVCQDYDQPLEAAAGQAACENSANATWSTSACAKATAVGGCVTPARSNVGCVTTWYFPPLPAAQLMTGCAQNGGTWITP
jgi:hypothetical protein